MRTLSRSLVAMCASPAGVVVLAALDSTVFFSLPFGIDAAVILLAAQDRTFAWAVPVLATAGSLAGAALTFWMGAKIGENGLERYVPRRRLERIRRRVRNSGALTLAALDLIPPPFPFTPFVLAGGAFGMNPWTFFTALAAVRALRFGTEAALAFQYGSGILRWTKTPAFQMVVTGFIVLAVIGTIVSAVLVYRSSKRR